MTTYNMATTTAASSMSDNSYVFGATAGSSSTAPEPILGSAIWDYIKTKGIPIASAVTGLASGVATLLGTFTVANLNAALTKKLPYIFAQSAVAVPLTGTLVETTLATVSIPGNTLGPNGSVRVTACFSTTNNANAKTAKIKFGGTVYTTGSVTTTATARTQAEIHNRNATNSQVGHPTSGLNTAFTSSTATIVTSALDTTASQDIVITGTLANTGDTMTLEYYTVEVLYGA